ncbi:MAG: sugar ABC transporter permease [Saccharospirillum sp.]|uniref:carbohydrate ABC transporter permease n=1 Tax=Saccharospirillum sp. TaxID=2033801 RepID=UPI0032979B93
MNRFVNINGWGFVSLSLALILAFAVYPIIQSLWLSTQVGKGVVTEFGGLTNVYRLFRDPLFKTALFNTFIFLLVQVPIMLTLALVLANTLNNPDLKYKNLFRIAIFLPCVTSLVAYSLLFKGMFSQDGVINSFLLNLHLINEPIGWLTDPFWAKITIITAITWRWTGYNMIFYIAALQNVDRSIYEAADLEGANAFQKFTRITVPMLKPVILFTTVISTIGTLQLFDEIMNITNGGPANSTITLSVYIYKLSFQYVPNFGYAATVSYVIVLIVALLSILQFKVAGKDA